MTAMHLLESGATGAEVDQAEQRETERDPERPQPRTARQRRQRENRAGRGVTRGELASFGVSGQPKASERRLALVGP